MLTESCQVADLAEYWWACRGFGRENVGCGGEEVVAGYEETLAEWLDMECRRGPQVASLEAGDGNGQIGGGEYG